LGVDVSGSAIAAFAALVLAIIVVGVVYYARRKGHLHSRPALIALAVLAGLLVVYGMTGGFLPLR
jgi:hypothetical protein